MISVQEVAETFAGDRPSIGEVNTVKECIVEALVSLGVSPYAEWDFSGPRRRRITPAETAAEHLVEKYIGGVPHVGDVNVIKEGIERGMKKIGL